MRHGETFGDPLQANNLGQREYARLITAAGVRRIKFHGLRHYLPSLTMSRPAMPGPFSQDVFAVVPT